MLSQPGINDSNKGFELEHFEPAYLAAHRRSELDARADVALKELADCCACPRNCHVRGHGVKSRPDKYADIDRHPYRAELDAAYEAARKAGLWRFDERSHVRL